MLLIARQDEKHRNDAKKCKTTGSLRALCVKY